MSHINYKSDYLSKNLITYLGNKRKLLPFIDGAVERLIMEDPKLSELVPEDITFFDIFSGSGIVSRYAKEKGYTTLSNDLEIYTKPISDTFIATSPSDLELIFAPVRAMITAKLESTAEVNVVATEVDKKISSSYQFVLSYINDGASAFLEKDDTGRFLRDVPDDAKYFCKHYAPAETNSVNFNTERLFYTQENARIIDIIIFKINDEHLFTPRAKSVILAELLYLMSKHINTSGIMKAFHNGWGGSKGAALNRILGKITLSGLSLIDGPKGKVFVGPAEEVFDNNADYFQENRVNIIYADPPYNQHQYSSNYHLLTTAVQNDGYQPGAVEKGSRAGIRRDHNRSDFCAKRAVAAQDGHEMMAVRAFKKFMRSIQGKADYLLVSYNDEGIIKHPELAAILSNNGRNDVRIESRQHDKYKGGRTPNARSQVTEFLFIVTLDKNQDKHAINTFAQAAEPARFGDENVGLGNYASSHLPQQLAVIHLSADIYSKITKSALTKPLLNGAGDASFRLTNGVRSNHNQTMALTLQISSSPPSSAMSPPLPQRQSAFLITKTRMWRPLLYRCSCRQPYLFTKTSISARPAHVRKPPNRTSACSMYAYSKRGELGGRQTAAGQHHFAQFQFCEGCMTYAAFHKRLASNSKCSAFKTMSLPSFSNYIARKIHCPFSLPNFANMFLGAQLIQEYARHITVVECKYTKN